MSQNFKVVCVGVNPNPKYAKAKTDSKCFGMRRYESKFTQDKFEMFNANTKYAKAKTNSTCFVMRRYESKFKSQGK